MTSQAKGTTCAKPQRDASQSDPRRVHLCLGVACGFGHVPGWGCPAWGGRLPPHECPLLVQRKVYLVEAVLMSFLLGAVEADTPAHAQSVVRQVLDLLWLFMEVRLLASGLRPLLPGPTEEGALGNGRPGACPHPGRHAAWHLSRRTTRYTIASSS